jgi:polyketide synthase-associated protein
MPRTGAEEATEGAAGDESRLVPLDAAAIEFPGEYEDEFILKIIEDVRQTGYSLVQMPALAADERTVLAQEVKEKKNSWTVPKGYAEATYLGLNNATKSCELPEDPAGPVESDDMLPMLDRVLTNFTLALFPHCSSCFGFEAFGRLNSYLRTPFSTTEEMALRDLRQPKNDDNLFVHLNFLERRKLCLLYLIDGPEVGGAQVTLVEENGTEIGVTMRASQLLVFRHDLLSYAYKPGANDIALQTWILTEPWVADAFDDKGVVELPEHMQEDNRLNILASHTYTAGDVGNVEQFWSGLFSATDGQVKVPTSRWDHSLYYTADGPGTPGIAYAQHGAFMNDEALMSFDNVFFRIDEAEVASANPTQRLILEVGYETLAMVGYTKESLVGRKIATMVGDSQSDWVSIGIEKAPTPTTYAGCINAITASRLAFALGLRGPVQHIDTACSSSLVALDRGHKLITYGEDTKKSDRHPIGSRCNEALIQGVSLALDPHLYIGYSGATMLSKKGRCFTFNDSADGFARGEGVSSLFLHASTLEEGHPEMLCALVGSFTNQDGKSASMTAPNGPSQRAATKASLQMSQFRTSDVSACECHGTGTALGDPIEVSALRGAFAASKSDHPMPLPHSSAKTNMGHNEANAGLLGLTKCIMMLAACTNSPNNHLKEINSNLDVNGYPALFGCAAFPFGTNTGLMGVSSFGSGGTNARADVWGRCMRGAAKTVAYFDTDEIVRKRGVYLQRVDDNGRAGPVSDDLIYLVGSWDAWKGFKDMPRQDDGTYQAIITIGETLSEQFHIVVNRDEEQVIRPAVPMASPQAPIEGPVFSADDKHWVINGSKDQVHVGATFKVTLTWKFDWERGEAMKIAWEPAKEDPELKALQYIHEYSVVATWTSWKMYGMISKGDGVYTSTTRIGQSGQEAYQIVRDKDWAQVIHPAVKDCIKTTVPVRGPDANGKEKNWILRGPPGSLVTLTLTIRAGNIEVSHHIDGKGMRKWKSTDDGNWHDYYISGSWNGWAFSAMDFDGRNSYRHRFVMDRYEYLDFCVIMDKDWQQTLQPGDDGHVFCGPPTPAGGWRIEGAEGTEYEVVLVAKAGVWTVEWKAV